MKLVVITQTVCKYCEVVKNYLKDEGAEFEVINIDHNPEAIDEYGIMSTPVTLLLDEDDDEIARVTGDSEEDLDVLISQL